MNEFLIRTFIKNHKQIKDPKVREKYGQLAGIVGIISNLFLCTIKIVVGMLVNSIAIIADGFNNLADASSSIITLIGFKLAAMPEDKDHPYGHARIEYLTGLLISAIIIVLGFQLLKTSFEKVLHPDVLEFNYITIVVLVVAIGVKVWQAKFNISTGKKINSVALMATGSDSRNDVISTSAVLLSILLGKATGLHLDGIMGCLVALFIIWSGVSLIRETSSPLLGEAPDPELVKEISEGAKSVEGVLGIHDLVVHNYGPGRIFASIHIEVDADGDIMEIHDMIDNIERDLSEKLRIHLVAHLDPVKTNDPLIKELRSVIEKSLSCLDGVTGMHDLRVVPGPTHTNIIFDAVLQPECKIKESEIKEIVNKKVKEMNRSYFVIITFDKAYTHL